MMKTWTGLALTVLGAVTAVGAAPSTRPNIVVILADDQGYADVSYSPHSPPEVSTPNIDRLAASGVVCTQGYTSGSVCAPTRAGLMTGRYQQRAGIYTGGQGGSGMPLRERWIPMHLKPGGYVCGAFGKWHLGLTEAYHPINRGFDYFYGFMGRGGHDYWNHSPDNKEKFGGAVYRNLDVLQNEAGYLTSLLTKEAVDFIHGEKAHPFFAYIAYNAVHAPAQAPVEDIERFDTGDETRDVLMAMLHHLDLGVGDIVQALKEADVYDNTLVFYLSDNGGASAMHADNTPLRGFKHSYHEGGTRVPFIVSWPGRLVAGTTCNVPVWSTDLLATLLAAAGLDPLPGSEPLDGKNMLPVLSGGEERLHDALYWSDGDDGKWAVRSGDWKVVSDKGHMELFDIANDIGETKDLNGQFPETTRELTARYDAWLAEMADPINGSRFWRPDATRTEKTSPARVKAR